jgi:hypothetical protein
VEACIRRRDLSHPPGWETGRASDPDYMSLNLLSVRHVHLDEPRVVVLQVDDGGDVLNPRGLLVAYEEDGHVRPVASDMDALLIGTRGVAHPSMPEEHHAFAHSLIRNVEAILATPSSDSWWHRWVHVVKGDIDRPPPARARQGRRRTVTGSLDGSREDGQWGFGDELTAAMISQMAADSAEHGNGAVRHGAEAFNYYMPQELDDEFLIIWDGFPAGQARWQYATPEQLHEFLMARIADGYTFPLNPKWILCDKGWYDLYRAQAASATARVGLDAWLPPASGLRERIEAVHGAYPDGFVRQPPAMGEELTADMEMEKAELKLRRYRTFKRAKQRLLFVLRLATMNRCPPT